MSDVFSKLTFMKTKLRNLELVIWMFSQKLFTMKKTTLFKQQSKVRKTTKFIITNDGGLTEFYNCPLFPWSICLDMVTHESSSDPFWAFKNQEWKLVFLHWACVTKFSFVQVKPYATMGRAYLGRVQFPYRALSPKVGMRKSMIHKRIKKNWKLVL